MKYWDANRERQKKTIRQFLLGIPIGLLFVIPIVASLMSGWYKRANMIVNTQDFNPLVLIVALVLIVGFVAIFSKRYKWDMNEQHYLELKAKKALEEAEKQKN